MPIAKEGKLMTASVHPIRPAGRIPDPETARQWAELDAVYAEERDRRFPAVLAEETAARGLPARGA